MLAAPAEKKRKFSAVGATGEEPPPRAGQEGGGRGKGKAAGGGRGGGRGRGRGGGAKDARRGKSGKGAPGGAWGGGGGGGGVGGVGGGGGGGLTGEEGERQEAVPVAGRRRGKAIVEEQLVAELLESMGVAHFHDGVVAQLVEAMHGFSETVLRDAFDYALHAGRKTTETEDLKLALLLRDQNCAMPSRETMLELAQEVNQRPLPPIPGLSGLRLPPAEFLNTSRPLRVQSKAHEKQGASRAAPERSGAPSRPRKEHGSKPSTKKKTGKTLELNIPKSLPGENHETKAEPRTVGGGMETGGVSSGGLHAGTSQ